MRKIIAGARNVANGKERTLKLGNLDIERDWDGLPNMSSLHGTSCKHRLQMIFVVATGESWPLREVIRLAFQSYGLDWRDHVVSDPTLIRPLDLWYSRQPAQIGAPDGLSGRGSAGSDCELDDRSQDRRGE